MTIVGALTIAALLVALAAIVRAALNYTDIGFDGHEAGPWRRPEPVTRKTQLPADFVGIWSLFGSKSIDEYAGSWEAAVRHLQRLDEDLPGAPADPEPAPSEPSADWLADRVAELEARLALRPDPGRAGRAVVADLDRERADNARDENGGRR